MESMEVKELFDFFPSSSIEFHWNNFNCLGKESLFVEKKTLSLLSFSFKINNNTSFFFLKAVNHFIPFFLVEVLRENEKRIKTIQKFINGEKKVNREKNLVEFQERKWNVFCFFFVLHRFLDLVSIS